MNVILDLEPDSNCDIFKIPAQIELRGDNSLFLWIGSSAKEPTLTSLILAYPTGSATVAISNGNSISMEAALSTSKRIAQRYKRPLLLSYPPELIPQSDEGTFQTLETALCRELDKFLEK